MEITVTQKYLRLSPSKVRPVIALIKHLSPARAMETLPLIGKKAARPLAKVIKSALAIASQKGISGSDLVFKEIRASEGPRLKRGIPVSRGRWHPIVKRMSHLRVVLRVLETKPKIAEVKTPPAKKVPVQTNKAVKTKGGQ